MASSRYPGTLPTFTTKTDKVDLVQADHMNQVQIDIVDIATELGTDPAGSVTDVVTRIDKILSSTGALRNGTSFPGTTEKGLVFFKSDEDVIYFRNNADTDWLALGQSNSNTIFAWVGKDGADSTNSKYFGTSDNPTSMTAANDFYGTDIASGGYNQIIPDFKFLKTSGISNVDIHARIWSEVTSKTVRLKVTFDPGGVGANNNVNRSSATSPGWATSSQIDVSGLSNGTVYDVRVEMTHDEAGNAFAYCSGLVLVGS